MKYYPENNYKIEKNKLPDFFKTNTVCLNDKGWFTVWGTDSMISTN